MKILSMTATFGKLENSALDLKDGLHIIHAPNEWGKSTWCAFILAMLYGIDTKERTKAGSLADKEHFAPWSGAAMSGRMEVEWQGRHITLERSSKGRIPMGVFRAYETQSGMEVTELNGDNCGEMLLGVEKEVFKRAGFLRLADLPVTQDDSLRSRLNALVTTGDESGTAEKLSSSLRELRNKVRSNRSNGLLPQAEAQRDELERKLLQLAQLRQSCEDIQNQQAHLSAQSNRLANHLCALDYEENQTYQQKLYAARAAQEIAREKEKLLETQCKELPSRETLQEKLKQLRILRQRKDEQQNIPYDAEPSAPSVPGFFQGLDGQSAIRQAAADTQAYRKSQLSADKKGLGTLGLILLIAGLLLLLIPHWVRFPLCAAAVITGFVLWRMNAASRKQAGIIADKLNQKYYSVAVQNWEPLARDYAASLEDYRAKLAQYRTAKQSGDRQAAALQAQIQEFTQGNTLSACEQTWTEALSNLAAWEDAKREQTRTAQLVQALESSKKEVLPPKEEDTLTLTREQTLEQQERCNGESHQLQLQLGQCQGRMEKIGQEDSLRKELAQVQLRIAKLTATLDALTLAQDTLAQASAELQRRFAPQISRQALSYFSALTGGRYDRLTLAADFTVHAGAQDESTLHEAIWRSEGTVDQLYLALRLSVAQAIAPDAPLILDDALVRFDDTRLSAALSLLQEVAQDRQVILFTCQSRENNLLNA